MCRLHADRGRGRRGRVARHDVNKLRGKFTAVAVKGAWPTTTWRIRQDKHRQRSVTEELGLKLENTKLSQLGRARKVVVDKDTTTIIDGAGDTEGIKGRIKQPGRRSSRPTRTSTARSCRSV